MVTGASWYLHYTGRTSGPASRPSQPKCCLPSQKSPPGLMILTMAKRKPRLSSKPPDALNNHVRPFNIRPESGGPRELEKRKCPETPVSCPARSSTSVLLKNKRQQSRHNPYTEPNVTIVTQNIRGTQGSKDPQGNITDLGDIPLLP
jgi:hypothetical protein